VNLRGRATTGDRKELHSGNLQNLYSSPNIIRVIKSKEVVSAGNVACMGEMRKRPTYIMFVGKPEEKKPLGRPRCK
jgi:hypothetical protein